MGNERGGVVRDVLREVGVAVASWLLALTALFLVVDLGAPGLVAETFGAVESAPFDPEEFVVVQWGQWVWSASTFAYGTSYYYRAPVAGLIADRLGTTLRLLAATAVMGAVLGAPILRVVAAAVERDREWLVLAPAYLASTVPPFLAVYAVLVAGLDVGALPATWPSGGAAGGDRLLALGLLGTAIALPFVGMAARRFRLFRSARANGEPPGIRELASPAAVRTGTLELWLYIVYVVGSVVTVEVLFAVPGLGRLWLQGIHALDFPLVLGLTALVVLLFVLAALARNLLVLAADARGAEGEPASDRESTTDGERQESASTTDGGNQESEATMDGGQPPAGAILRDALRRRAVAAGAGGFGLALAAGLLGSLLPDASGPPAAGDGVPVAVGPEHLLGTLGVVATVALLAAVVAVPLGVIVGVLAGRAGPAATTALRPLTAVGLLVPPQLLVSTWFLGAGAPDDRTGFVLAVGALGGLVLAAFAFRFGHVAAGRARDDGHRPGLAVEPALVGTVGRTLGHLPVVVFLAVELAFVGWVGTPGVAPAFVQLAQLRRYLLAADAATVVAVLAVAYLAVALPALSLALLGDGVSAVAVERETDDS